MVNFKTLLTIFILSFCQNYFAYEVTLFPGTHWNISQLIRHNEKEVLFNWLQGIQSDIETFSAHSLQTRVGINEYLKPLEHCFVHLTNFQYVDIAPWTTPIFLSTPHMSLLLKWVNENYFSEELIMTPRIAWHEYNLNLTSCPISNYLDGTIYPFISGQTSGYCVQILFHRFVPNSKPWNCEAQISLFPGHAVAQPVFTRLYEPGNEKRWLRNFYYWQFTFSYKTSLSPLHTVSQQSRLAFPSSVYPIHMIILKKAKPDLKPLQNIYLKEWYSQLMGYRFKLRYDESISRIVRAAMYLIEIDTEANSVSIIYQIKARQKYLEYVKLENIRMNNCIVSHLCYDSLKEDTKQLVKYGYNINEKILGYKVEKSGIIDHILQCENTIISRKSRLKMPKNFNKNDMLSHGYASVWMSSVMQNYSIHNLQFITCHNNKKVNIRTSSFEKSVSIVTFRYFGHKYHYSPISLQNPVKTLKFVSCGEAEIPPLAYNELIAAFDKWTWLAIFSVMFILFPITIGLAKAKYTIFKIPYSGALASLRSLLEQGNTFSEKELRNKHLGCLFVIILLSGVVISNAYKNDHIYNVISPRRTKPYDTFSQLIRDEFVVYSRITEFYRYLFYKDSKVENISISVNSPQLLGIQKTISFGIESLQNVTFNSEIYSVAHDIKSFVTNSPEEDESIHNLDYILGNTTMAPGTVGLLDDWSINYIYNTSWISWFQSEQNAILNHVITKCNRVALILSEIESYEMAHELKKHSEIYASKVFVGKDVLTEEHYGFSLAGVLPYFIQERFALIEAAGIWNWWADFVRHSVKSKGKNLDLERLRLERPNMNGNVAILFVLLGIGNGIALLGFLIEMWFYVLMVQKITTSFIKYKSRYIFNMFLKDRFTQVTPIPVEKLRFLVDNK